MRKNQSRVQSVQVHPTFADPDKFIDLVLLQVLLKSSHQGCFRC